MVEEVRPSLRMSKKAGMRKFTEAEKEIDVKNMGQQVIKTQLATGREVKYADVGILNLRTRMTE